MRWLATLPRVKTHKHTATHAGHNQNPCQPSQRLENGVAFDQPFSFRRARRSQGYLFQLLVGVLCFAKLADRLLILAALLPRLAQAAGAALLRLDAPLGQFGFHFYPFNRILVMLATVFEHPCRAGTSAAGTGCGTGAGAQRGSEVVDATQGSR